jgi:hypothetical protein
LSFFSFTVQNPAIPKKNIVVHFQSSQPGGIRVDANWHTGTKEFELIRGDYGPGQEMPGGIFVPAADDLYLLSDMKMPQAYIDAAERELLEITSTRRCPKRARPGSSFCRKPLSQWKA